MSHALRGPLPFVLGLTVVVAISIGVASGVDGRYAAVGLVAVAAGAAILYRPIVGVVLLVALVPIENVFMLGGLTGPKIIGLTVFSVWLLRKVARRESWGTVVRSPLFLTGLAFMGMILLSILWAANSTIARTGFVQIAQMVMLALIIVDVARPWKNVDAMVKGLVLGGLIAAMMTVAQSQMPGVRRAGDEVSGGINATAVTLVTLIPFSFYLIRSRQNLFWRLTGIAFIGSSVVAVVLTLSRFNLLLLPLLLLGMSFLTWRDGRKNRRLLIGAAIVGAIGMSIYTPWDDLIERSQSIAPYIAETIGQSEGGVSGRGYHLKIGFEIFKDYPIVGVGYNNYGEYFRDEYQFEVFGREKLYRNLRSAHSSYVGLLADLGIIGLTLWLLVLGTCAKGLYDAWRYSAPWRDSHGHLLIQSLAAALALHALGYGLYDPNHKEKILWIVLGMAFAAIHMVKTAAASEMSDTGG